MAEVSTSANNQDQELNQLLEENEVVKSSSNNAVVNFLKGLVAIAALFIPQRRFLLHRVFGLFYLIQWVLAFYFYFANYEWFIQSFLVWCLPITGVVQAISATLYFWFLPKRQSDHGYFSDKKPLSYNFVKENIFFSSLLAFQWLYFSDRFFLKFQKFIILEQFFVFVPYVWRNRFFPKTSFREGLTSASLERNKTAGNRTFYLWSTRITKAFYIWAKHFIGYFLNYARFLDRITPEQQYHAYFLLIFSCFATTISMFLHTLKFRKLLSPRASFLIYAASYLITFYTFIRIADIFFSSFDLCLLALGGLIVNFSEPKYQNLYQVFVLILLNLARNNYISLQPSVEIPYFPVDKIIPAALFSLKGEL